MKEVRAPNAIDFVKPTRVDGARRGPIEKHVAPSRRLSDKWRADMVDQRHITPIAFLRTQNT